MCQVKAKCPACFWAVPSPGRLYQEEQPLVLRIVVLPDANVELFFYALDVVAGLSELLELRCCKTEGEIIQQILLWGFLVDYSVFQPFSVSQISSETWNVEAVYTFQDKVLPYLTVRLMDKLTGQA